MALMWGLYTQKPFPHSFNLVGWLDGECVLMGLHLTSTVTKGEDFSILGGINLNPMVRSRTFRTLSGTADGGVTQTLQP